MPLDAALLISKLNPTCHAALERAAVRCKARANYSVEVEHWLLELIDEPDSDLRRLLAHADVEVEGLRRDLVAAVGKLRVGNNRTPSLSPLIDEAIREAFVLAAVQYGDPLIRSGALLLAILTHERLVRVAREISRPLARVAVDPLIKELPTIVAGSAESSDLPVLLDEPGTQAGTAARGGGIATPALDRFTVDLTAKARAGEIDPILGRDGEIRQMADILIRRRQNNPILTGEAGVGKTAVVEGFALRVAQGDVPPPLKDVAVRSLDLGLLQAGAGVKGEFEDRLKGVIAEVKASPIPIILFIDEAHTMIGAGGQAGQGDAANLLKPALARGELRTIAATTWAEYKKYFEKDAALARRFQVIKVEEPAEDWAIAMMRGMAPMLEAHHGVRILDEAIDACVRLSARYITGRQLPDKSLGVLDTACARVALGRDSVPAEVEDLRRQVEILTAEITSLRREGLVEPTPGDRVADLEATRDQAQAALTQLEERWTREVALVAEARALRARIESGTDPAAAALRAEHQAKTAALRAVQGTAPLVHASVDAQVVAEIVAAWTGVPVGRMQADEIHAVLALRQTLARRVLGQTEALEAICARIEMARAGMTDPRRPVGVFLLVGPSGVGKTETAHALAEALFGGEQSLIAINMSEYQEAHTVSGLKGSPPGYVGYGEGGVLTEAVRRKPYSVVLLDEVEKAHPDVLELFYQVFDKGTLDDAEGREVNFKSTVILLTSNVASDLMTRLHADPETAPRGEALAEAIRPELLNVFKPAFLARMAVVPYAPILDDVMRQIAHLQLDGVARRLLSNHGAKFTYDEAVVGRIIDRCTEVTSGARNVDHILTRTLLPALSTRFLARMAEGLPITSAHVSVDDRRGFAYEVA